MEIIENKKTHFSVGETSKNKNMMTIFAIVAGITVLILTFVIPIESSAANSNMLIHNHVNLNVTMDGKPIIVPINIGIKQTGIFADPQTYADHSLDNYGMEGMSPLHTHDYSGTIHVESNTVKNYTLGDFLNIWKGLNIDDKNIIASVDGKAISNFRDIILTNGAKIKLDITS